MREDRQGAFAAGGVAGGGVAGGGVAVVLSGAGARGAYEAGALSVILPALGPSQPRWYLGTSVGAINAVGFAARSHDDPDKAGGYVNRQWRTLRQGDVFRPPLSSVLRAAARRVVVGGRVRPQPVGLLDTAPLDRTLRRLVNWHQFHVNVRHRFVDACGVVATEKSSRRSKVFLECAPSAPVPNCDDVRGIAFERATLAPAHVAGSSAIPALFPAVAVGRQGIGGEWYADGGIRLNTPIKPAIMLGARRIVVVSTSPASLPPVAGDALARPPGIASGLVDVVRAVTEDRMLEDLRTLVRDNDRVLGKRRGPSCDHESEVCTCPDPRRRIEYVFAGPPAPKANQLGELAHEVLRARRLSLAGLVARSPDLCELASHVLFHPEFIEGAIELGRHDARQQLRGGSVVWRSYSLPEAP